jgi:ABC-type glycerol-3-phosphate transport system permease component
MDVFGLEPIQAAIIVIVIEVILQVGLGYKKSDYPFDADKLLTSVIIAVIMSITVVATAIQGIPEDFGDLQTFIVLVGIVGSIAGVDQLVKNTGGAITSILSNKQKRKQRR